MDYTVSVIIRSHNDLGIVQRTIDGLLAQKAQDFEIIVCDDKSTDGTAEFLHDKLDGRAIFLPPQTDKYVPGKVLNRAVQAAHGNILAFNNADAVILGENWLQELVDAFSSPDIACVFAQQIPRIDASPMVRRDYENAFGDGSVSAKWRHFFSLASSAARRDLLIKYPFSETLQYSEDVDWSWRMRQLGFKAVYVPQAIVEHSHNYTPKELWKRFYNEGLADAAIYGDKSQPAKAWMQVAAETLRDWVYCMKQAYFLQIFQAPFYRYRQKISHDKGLADFRK